MRSPEKKISKGGGAPRVQGAGSVDELPSGRHRVRFTYRGKTLTEVVDTKEEAEALRRALVQKRDEAERAAAEPAAPEVETVATWGERWLKRRRDLKLVRWPRVDETRWARYVAGSPLAAARLADVRPRDVQAFVDGLAGTGGGALDRSTVTRVVALVKKCFADAARDERIPDSPARRVAVPKTSAVKEDPWTYLTDAEVRAVEGCAAMPERARLTFTVAIRTGLRAGELWALRWRDVDLDGATPSVTVRASHGSAPKNGKVQRVPLLPAAREALLALRRLAGGPAPDALVFPSASGERRARGDDARWAPEPGPKGKPPRFAGYRAVAGIEREVRFHDLRHTFASHLVMGTWTEAPLPLAEVRALMRHGSVAMTERYAHLSPDHLHARIAGSAARGAAGGDGVTTGVTNPGALGNVTRPHRPSRNPYF